MYKLGMVPDPIDKKNLYGIFRVLSTIKDNTFSIEDYATYLDYGVGRNGIFAAWDESLEVKAVLHMIAPSILDKTKGYVLFAACDNDVELPVNISLLEIGEEWLLSKGATHWTMTTKRNPKSWIRRYSLKVWDDEMTLGKAIKS